MEKKYQIVVDMNPVVKGPNKFYIWEIKSILEDGEWATVATGTSRSAHDAFEAAESKHLMLVCKDACLERNKKQSEMLAKILDEEDLNIWKMWCDGYPQFEIAHHTGVNVDYVRGLIDTINNMEV